MTIKQILNNAAILPVIILDEIKHAVPLAQALAEGGISTLEITLRTPIALEVIKILKEKVPQCVIGAGTVTQPAQFSVLKKLAVDFAVSPGITSELIHAAQAADIPYLPAVATPSDILLAIEHNLSVVKFFPADLCGGAKALRNFASVFPNMSFCPTGGINAENMANYLSLTNVISIGGSWLAPKNLIELNYWQDLTNLASAAVHQSKSILR